LSQVLVVESAEAHATSSTASQGAAAIAVGRSNAAGCETRRDAAALELAAGVADKYPLTEVDDQRHRGIRNHLEVDEIVGTVAKSCHGDPGEPARREGTAISHGAVPARTGSASRMSRCYE
jgi:hypothetical protein